MSSRNSAGGCRSASDNDIRRRMVDPGNKPRTLQMMLHQPCNINVILKHKYSLTQALPSVGGQSIKYYSRTKR